MKPMSGRLTYLPLAEAIGSIPGPMDEALLSQFVIHRDGAAFELLVRRHAAMVLGVCRRLLIDANDVDDAFQATFLVLARKASSITRGKILASWLHRVAFRASLRVRTDRTKRFARQVNAIDQLPSRPQPDPAWSELSQVLDEEVVVLPERLRKVFVLCCLEGKTGEEASQLLGCPPGTISSRLTRARERLRFRLTRRGFAPAAILLMGLNSEGLIAAAPNALIDSTLRAAPTFLAGWSNSVLPSRSASIAEGVMRVMILNKLRFVPLLFVVGLLAAGAVIASSIEPATEPIQTSSPAAKATEAEKAASNDKICLIRPQQGGVEWINNQGANIEASRQAKLHPFIQGQLKKVEVNVGDRVKAGQVLGEIDSPGLVLDQKVAAIAVEQARGLLLESKARLLTANAELEAAKGIIKLKEAEVNAARSIVEHRKRDFELTKVGGSFVALKDKYDVEGLLLSAKVQLDTAIIAVDNAKIDLSVKSGKLKQAEAEVQTAETNVLSASIALEKANLLIETQTKIVAPFNGIVSQRNCQTGDFVSPGAVANPTLLFTIMQADIVTLQVSIPANLIHVAKPGLVVDVDVPDVKGLGPVAGKLVRVGVTIGTPDDSRAVRGEIEIPNPKGEIVPGMGARATVKLRRGQTDALRVPPEAVVQLAGEDYPDGLRKARIGKQQYWGGAGAVYVFRDGKARLTPVKVGYIYEDEIELLSGVTSQDLVVSNPKDLNEKDIERPTPKKETK